MDSRARRWIREKRDFRPLSDATILGSASLPPPLFLDNKLTTAPMPTDNSGEQQRLFELFPSAIPGPLEFVELTKYVTGLDTRGYLHGESSLLRRRFEKSGC